MIRVLLTILWRFVLFGAWVVVLVALALVVVEESGVLTRFARRAVAWRLGSLGRQVSIDRVSLRWFEPGVVLEGVSLHTLPTETDPAEELLRLRSVHFALHADWERSMPLRRLRIDGGRIRISDRLLRGLNRFATSLPSEDEDVLEDLSPPPFVVRNFEVELELPDQSVLEIGSVTLRAFPDAQDGFRLSGRLVPSLSGAVQGPVEVRVDGRQWDSGVKLEATAVGVQLATSSFRVPAYLGSLPIEECEGRLTLRVEGEVRFGEQHVARGSLVARLEDGRLLPKPDEPWLENIAADVEARFHPDADDEFWGRDAWTVASRLRATWLETPIQLWGEFGSRVPRDAVARVWGRAERLPLEETTLRALGAMETYRNVWEAFAPSGFADASVGLILRSLPDASAGVGWDKEIGVLVRNTGHSSATFHGFRTLEGERAGLPVTCRNLRGEAIYTLDEERPRPYRLGLVDLRADVGSGAARGWALMTAPVAGSGTAEPELDFVFDTSEIAIDDELRDAFAQSTLTRDIWPAYDPSGGSFSSSWRFRRGPETNGLTAAGRVAVDGTSLRWAEVPIPLHATRGELTLLWAQNPSFVRETPDQPYRPFGVAYSLQNAGSAETPTGVVATISGFAREESLPPTVDRDEIPELWVEGIEIEVDELLLRGEDWKVLTEEFPDLGPQTEILGAKGSIRLSFKGGRARPTDPYVSDAEATPMVVEMRPIFFERRTKDIEGRVLVRTVNDEQRDDAYTRCALAGTWPGGVELAAWADMPPFGRTEIGTFGAGIDAENSSFRGALARVLASEDLGMGTEIDFSGSSLRGPVDLAVNTWFLAESDDPATNTYYIFLRNNSLEHENILLDALNGVLEQSGDTLRSSKVEAELAGHPVLLRDVAVYLLEDKDQVPEADPVLLRSALLNDPQALALQASVDTHELPLDEEHLSSILDEEYLQLVRDSPSWRGRLDVEGATLMLTSPVEPEREGILAMRGSMRPHDIELRLGFPIVIDEAFIDLREFVMEESGVRAWGKIDRMKAQLAERELSDASMILGLVDERITIDDLAGDFEGGRLESFGSGGIGTRKAFGVDVAEPHRFDVAVRMNRVHVDRLLRGIFASSVADEGYLDASLQLSGTTDDVLALTGRGTLSLSEGRLWSIPAARVLFSRLGFPNTAVFDELQARFELRDGVIDTRYISVESALLKLLGSGTLDLDGGVSYDLEVHYSLLDKLGILNRLLYLLNNSLWRVAVRGDLERPIVSIRNSWVELFREFDETPARGLPLPSFAEPPERF